jgi:hypothetical protein
MMLWAVSERTEMTRLDFLKMCVAAAGTTQLASASPEQQRLSIKNSAGLEWTTRRGSRGWGFGNFLAGGEPVDRPLEEGVLLLRNLFTAKERWLPASTAVRLAPDAVELRGTATVESSTLTFTVKIRLDADSPAAFITPRWSVDTDLTGWEVCLPCCGVGEHAWRCTFYPFAGNSAELRRERLSYVGVPAALLFRDDLSLVTLFGIDPALDYLNPKTWTGTTGFHFRDLTIPPQFRVCGGKIAAGIEYRFPLQFFFDKSGDSVTAISALVKNWIRLNGYKVQPLEVRTPDAALALYIEGRRRTPMWNPGKGYQIEDTWKAVYVAEIPISAYFDYLVWEATGERMWRDRAFESADFLLRAQHLDPSDRHYGVIDTSYELDTGRFTSADHTPIIGYRVDMNAFAARHLLLLWERVKNSEGLDRNEWYQAAVHIAEWVLKQQNADGGMPQHVNYRTGRKSISVVSGRTLLAMPVIYRLTERDEFRRLSDDLERFLRERVEAQYWFTGQHVDLWPGDYESDSVWCAIEYWLDKYERTQQQEALKRAEADAWLAFLMWCPKQLSWVRNPTQTCHAEQEHYLQYSNYCYNNRKIECLFRLGRLTSNPLFTDLGERVMQCGIWAQRTEGPYQGAQYERMSDPWHGVSQDVNSKGELYMSELALDANLQLLEMGLAHPKRVAPGTATGRAWLPSFS